MQRSSRSSCPISKTLDIVGDKWSLLVVRQMVFGGSTTFKELSEIPERIATNILAERLERLECAGIIYKLPDPADGRKSIYKPSEKCIDLMSVLVAMIDWGMKYGDDPSYPKHLVDEIVKDAPKMAAEARALGQKINKGVV
ncbi:MAG TPA: helix-turn-helix domain-containing protein [Candidatus Saccharimonadales bacterium]|nr:helix-turn-helix domain-containing protein [Candidatus Saccharimonadales bacterium]